MPPSKQEGCISNKAQRFWETYAVVKEQGSTPNLLACNLWERSERVFFSVHKIVTIRISAYDMQIVRLLFACGQLSRPAS
jgi:hypothetical protein